MKKYAQYAAFFAAVLLAGVFQSAQAQSWVTGQWTQPYSTPVQPVHVAISPDGKKILVVAGSRNNGSRFRAGVLDIATGAFVDRDITTDLFCNAATFLPNGNVLFTGGTVGNNPWRGARSTVIFDWTTLQWIIGPPMADGRWYPTNTVFPDGRIMTIAGNNLNGGNNNTVEIYTPNASTGAWSVPYPTTPVLPWYPLAHMVPLNGGTDWRIFFSGSMKQSWMYQPPSGWSPVATSPNISGTSVLLTLRPENGYKSVVLSLAGEGMGGGAGHPANTAQIIDLSVQNPVWRPLASMGWARTQQNATLLPNGNVLVTGGSTSTSPTELFDPETERWTVGVSEDILRRYHSTALLLPDGRVWKGGSNPAGDGTAFEERVGIYSPPYLFQQGQRLVIASAPSAISYGGQFDVGFQNGQVAYAVFMRHGADTHGFNMEQRAVRLVSSSPSTGVLRVTAPPSGVIAPPGYYMLFLVDFTGVPSVAKIVRLAGGTPPPPPPPPPPVTCNGKTATKVGTASSETLNGTNGVDIIHGMGGNDTINGLAGNDTICGGTGNDRLYGGTGTDYCNGDRKSVV